ncbi:MAG: carbonic anhydrase [Candidatus Saccharicenans sp.]
MSEKRFVTAINCMDGRVQNCVNRWLKNLYQANYVDVTTAPGPARILASGEPEYMVASYQRCLTVSVEKHRSPAVAIVAHHDLAGNPLPRESQSEQLLQTGERLRNLFFELDIRLLWVDENWKVQEIRT